MNDGNPNGRFETTIYSSAGESRKLYRGDSLREAVKHAMEFPGSRLRRQVIVWDLQEVDWSPETGTQGEIAWWDEAEVAALEDRLTALQRERERRSHD